MKNNKTIFLTVSLICFLSSSLCADSYWRDTYNVLQSTAQYIVLRTTQSFKDSGSFVIDKLKGAKDSVCQWWNRKRVPTVIVIEK